MIHIIMFRKYVFNFLFSALGELGEGERSEQRGVGGVGKQSEPSAGVLAQLTKAATVRVPLKSQIFNRSNSSVQSQNKNFYFTFFFYFFFTV